MGDVPRRSSGTRPFPRSRVRCRALRPLRRHNHGLSRRGARGSCLQRRLSPFHHTSPSPSRPGSEPAPAHPPPCGGLSTCGTGARNVLSSPYGTCPDGTALAFGAATERKGEGDGTTQPADPVGARRRGRAGARFRGARGPGVPPRAGPHPRAHRGSPTAALNPPHRSSPRGLGAPVAESSRPI